MKEVSTNIEPGITTVTSQDTNISYLTNNEKKESYINACMLIKRRVTGLLKL